jgi:hypothetical protein
MKPIKCLLFGLLILSVSLTFPVLAQGNAKKQGGVLLVNQVATYMTYKQMAQQLVQQYPDSGPLVMEHARGLLADEPVKSWKHCVLQDTLQAHLDAQTRHASELAAQ